MILETSAGPGLTGWPNAAQFTTLTLLPAAFGGQEVTLTGTANALADGSITAVSSLMCVSYPPSLDPSVCNNGQAATTKTLATPVALSTGQQIYVTVSITFS